MTTEQQGALTTYGTGDFGYEIDLNWAQLPAGWSFHEVCDVAVDSRDRVYVFNRGQHPMLVFDRAGKFLTSWGEGLYKRPHGVTITPDDVVYCVDDGDHSVRKCTTDGRVLMTIGTPGRPAPFQSGQPFNRPTKVALDPKTGELYVSDGYGNARVHKYSPDGKLLFSWGEAGTDPGQFNLVHSVCTDKDGLVYVADRENHRIQIFEPNGRYITQWNNLHRPCGLYISPDQLVYIGEIGPALPLNNEYPNLGCRVSIYDLQGRRLGRVGNARGGDELPDQFVSPHGVTTDSHGDIYVGEVSYTASVRFGGQREMRSFRKLVKRAATTA